MSPTLTPGLGANPHSAPQPQLDAPASTSSRHETTAMKPGQVHKALRLFGSKTLSGYYGSKSKARIGIEALPDEILYQIFELISPQQRVPLHYRFENGFWEYQEPRELLCLIRCSRRLYQVGTPFLYNTFTQFEPCTWVPFIRTILESPDLLECVQNLKLSTRRYYQVLIDNTAILSNGNMQLMTYHLESRTIDDQIKALTSDNEASKTPQDVAIDSPSTSVRHKITARESLVHIRNGTPFPVTTESLAQRLKRTALNLWQPSPSMILSTGLPVSHDAEQIIRNLIIDDWKAMATYLIYRIPHLSTLTIEEDKYHPRSAELEPIIQRALSPQSISMPRLQKLILIYTARTNTSKLDTYWPLLLQPSLKSFSATKLQEYGWMPYPRHLTLPLTHLSLAECNLSSSSIDAFLKCCPNLEYLYYSHIQAWNEQPFFPKLFGSSIQHLRNTLKELILYREELQYNIPAIQERELNIIEQSLKQFTKLRKLDITAHLLIGPQKLNASRWWRESVFYECPTQGISEGLPSSLEELTLRDCGQKVWEQIKQLLDSDRDGVEGLKKIDAVFYAQMNLDRPGEASEEVSSIKKKFSVEIEQRGMNAKGIWEINSAPDRASIAP